MKAVEIIDNKINDLREVRKMIVKGERRFSKEKEMDKAQDFMLTLTQHGITYSTFEFGTGLFIKIDDEVTKNSVSVENIEE